MNFHIFHHSIVTVWICTVIKPLSTNSSHIWCWLVVSTTRCLPWSKQLCADYQERPWNDLPDFFFLLAITLPDLKQVLTLFFKLTYTFCLISMTSKSQNLQCPPDYDFLNEPRLMLVLTTAAGHKSIMLAKWRDPSCLQLAVAVVMRILIRYLSVFPYSTGTVSGCSCIYFHLKWTILKCVCVFPKYNSLWYKLIMTL